MKKKQQRNQSKHRERMNGCVISQCEPELRLLQRVCSSHQQQTKVVYRVLHTVENFDRVTNRESCAQGTARSGRHSLSDYVPSIPIITHSSRFSGLAQCHLPLTLEPHAGVPFFDYQTTLSISNLAFYRTRRLLLSSDGP